MASSIILPGSPSEIEFGFQQAREFIMEPFYKNPALTELFTIEQEIRGKKQLAYINNFGLSGKSDASCGFSADGSLTGSEKFWDPAPGRS